MGLKLLKATGLKRPLVIRDKFTVVVRHRTRIESEQFIEGLMNLDDDERARRCAEYFLDASDERAGGLTLDVARHLGVAVADDQATDESGCIALDTEVLGDLWRHSYADRFANPITAFSRDMLATVAREKEAAKND